LPHRQRHTRCVDSHRRHLPRLDGRLRPLRADTSAAS
jgi:hypothetical protein